MLLHPLKSGFAGGWEGVCFFVFKPETECVTGTGSTLV